MIILIYGPPGSGKSRLVSNLEDVITDIHRSWLEYEFLLMNTYLLNGGEDTLMNEVINNRENWQHMLIEYHDTNPPARLMSLADICISVGHFNYLQRFACITKNFDGPSGAIYKFLINEHGIAVPGSVTP